MKYLTLAVAAGLVLLANAIALFHAGRNRGGSPDCEITLTSRELAYLPDPDNSGITLLLRTTVSTEFSPAQLRAAGVDTSIDPSDARASEFFERAMPRTAFAALEYDGPAWQEHLRTNPIQPEPTESHLVPIDIAADAATLRARHPDRARVIIVPAVIRVAWQPATAAERGNPARRARPSGWRVEVPGSIHVPLPFSSRFRGVKQPIPDAQAQVPLYRVRLRYGSLHEPWVVGVEVP